MTTKEYAEGVLTYIKDHVEDMDMIMFVKQWNNWWAFPSIRKDWAKQTVEWVMMQNGTRYDYSPQFVGRAATEFQKLWTRHCKLWTEIYLKEA